MQINKIVSIMYRDAKLHIRGVAATSCNKEFDDEKLGLLWLIIIGRIRSSSRGVVILSPLLLSYLFIAYTDHPKKEVKDQRTVSY